MSAPYPEDKESRSQRRNRQSNGANAVTPSSPSPSTLLPPAPTSPPSTFLRSIARSAAVSILLVHCALLAIWSAASTLCCGDHGSSPSEGLAPTCPHTFYAEAGGQCVALVDATTSSGDSSAANLIRADDYSGGVLCHDAEVLLTLAQKYSPLWPLSPPIQGSASAKTCCDSLMIQNDRKDKPHPIEGIFGHYQSGRKRRREAKISTSSFNIDTDTDKIILRRIVFKHRNPSNVDKRHPIRRMVESAAAVFGRRKAIQRSERGGDAQTAPPSPNDTTSQTAVASTDWARDASSPSALHLDFSKKELVKMVTDNVRQQIGEVGDDIDAQSFDERVANVGWGGPLASGGEPWWLPSSSTKTEMNGERLAAAYAKIMGWPSTEEYTTKFPFKKCQEGCDPHFALVHSLEWREKFKPWCITPSAVRENRDSFFYVRGHSPPNPNDKDGDATIGHSLVFYRPGIHKYEDTESYIRLIMHTLDSAVADSYSRSNNKVGKFNIILDCNGFSLSTLPGLSEVKRLFTMMQDHFPDRLGVLMIVNLSGPGQLFLRMIKPIISEAVKRKIHIVPPTERGGIDMLKVLIEEEYIPTWLGGTDDYVLNPKVAYADRMCTEDEGREYHITIPYHAPS